MENIAVLKQLGFEEREIVIYMSLLKLGPASIREIARQAEINRGSTYEILKEMQKKGIVGYFPKGKRKFFCAKDPEELLHIAREKQAELSQAVGRLKQEVIPNLNLLKHSFGNTNVHYYEGDEGIVFVLKDLLNTAEQSPDKSYSVYSSKALRNHLYRPFPNFTKQRVQRNIKVRAIAIGAGGEDAPLAERKWLNVPDSQTSASYVAIYPPKCAMISLSNEDYPTAVVIDAPDIALVMKITFDHLWHSI